ncbi:hypothetical protein SAMN05660443_1864 [Marinospirillum celere]|uniref:Uncharacterized protein n=1 Tax=Marinospirillum celere TaxID=1122252 RepID=A0A1I1H983_9GAMM|nr:hypothetical protein [Marinospirillum celere]SFC20142.1 hypothetical protein SAMN05660443_1864 [Marinospirillum celere]
MMHSNEGMHMMSGLPFSLMGWAFLLLMTLGIAALLKYLFTK